MRLGWFVRKEGHFAGLEIKNEWQEEFDIDFINITEVILQNSEELQTVELVTDRRVASHSDLFFTEGVRLD